MDAVRARQSASTALLITRVLIFVTLGYWAFGKSFAYLGIYPLYIGEMVLGLGLLYLIHRGTIPVPNQLLFWFYWAFLIIVVFQALYSFLLLGQPLLEVIRNLAVVYYGLFALITYTLIVRFADQKTFYGRMLGEVLPKYAPWVLLGSTVTAVGYLGFSSALPTFPKAPEVTLLLYKPTDAVMPLIVILALWVRGYVKTRWLYWTVGLLAVSAARSRSAMLGVGVALLAMIVRPNRRMLQFIGVGAALFVFLLITDLKIELGYREVSARQFVANVTSVIGSDKAASEIDATTTRNKNWRAAWWDAIYTDAVENNRLLIGLGWGNNLADTYGFQTVSGDSINVLRNPHNAFLGILARGGWLAASTWVIFYVLLLIGLWKASRKFENEPAKRDAAWIIMIYVLVSHINGATDVFLESPQNAIPHWILVGVGWALIANAQELALADKKASGHVPGDGGKPAWLRPSRKPVRPGRAPLSAPVTSITVCPNIGLQGDQSSSGMCARPDHVCAIRAVGSPSVGWQDRYCVSGAYGQCPHWMGQRLERYTEPPSPRGKVMRQPT